MAGHVVVAGGGIVGRTIAVALASQSHIKVTLLAGPDPARDVRASAISAGGRRLFSRTGVWPALADKSQPVVSMAITDSRIDDAIRPEILTFEGGHGADAFAHIVHNDAIRAALAARCEDLGINETAESAVFYDEDETGVTVETDGGRALQADIIVGADGRTSRLRSIAGIGVIEKEYDQYGISGTISHARPHHGLATQHFLPAGPLATLPMMGEQSSLVWTERPGFARSMAEMDPMMASIEIERVFGLSLGRICVEPPLIAYPLKAMLARSYFAGRFCLAGDAAHVIHPLAGQGLNLGLRDAAALAELLIEAGRIGEDLSVALPRYEKWRRADATQMALVTDGLNTMFSRRSDILRAVRSIGLGLVDRRESLKAFFINEAAGLEGDVPRLMRGEAI
ncbi:MAG: FAD-dependent monooxygenase [Pseudomonadota bacterium]